MSYTTINTKFDIGDEVWAVMRRTCNIPRFKCPICNGSGANLYVENTHCSARFDSAQGKYKCIEGTMHKVCAEYYPQKITINRVEIFGNSLYSEDNAIEYRTNYFTGNSIGFFETYNEKDLFLSEQECQTECDRRNLEYEQDKPSY